MTAPRSASRHARRAGTSLSSRNGEYQRRRLHRRRAGRVRVGRPHMADILEAGGPEHFPSLRQLRNARLPRACGEEESGWQGFHGSGASSVSIGIGGARYGSRVMPSNAEQSCPAGSRLFVHRNPGQDVDEMVDLDGRPYRSLPTAFPHRARYVADCACRGNPWDEASVARHRAYAEAPKQTVAGKPAVRVPSTRTKQGTGNDQSWARRDVAAQGCAICLPRRQERHWRWRDQ